MACGRRKTLIDTSMSAAKAPPTPSLPAPTRLRRRRRLVRAVQRAGGRPGEALHRVGRLRPAACGSRHRGLARPRAHAGVHRDHHGRGSGRHRTRDGADPRRDRARRICLVARPGGRPPQHRKAPDGPGRRRRQAAAHRPLAQRPGGDRHAPVAARRHRRAGRANRRAAPRAARPGRNVTPRRSCRDSRTCRSRSRSRSATT